MARILILEPDKRLAATYQRALEHAGHKVDYATSGQSAIDIADASTPDLVVLELQLPAHNGLEFLYEFRSYVEWQAIPAVVNTIIPPRDLGSAEAVVHKELGISVWHYKPETNLQLLIRSVNELLQGITE